MGRPATAGWKIEAIAEHASVASSTVSETAAVRIASSMMETALALLASESSNKTELARRIDLDPQRVQHRVKLLVKPLLVPDDETPDDQERPRSRDDRALEPQARSSARAGPLRI